MLLFYVEVEVLAVIAGSNSASVVLYWYERVFVSAVLAVCLHLCT